MSRSSLIAVVVVVLVAVAAAWYFMMPQNAAAPTGTAGINGSPNQGNLGQPNNGQVQQPGSAAQDNGIGDASKPGQPGADGAEGSVIGGNVSLGTNSSANLGNYLVAYNGMTLYTFANDTTNKSNCTGGCAANWPPYIVGAEDNVAAQVKAGVGGKVDTIVRADGKAQVTYNGKPLYFYAHDTKAGDTTGQGVGGVWFVAKP
jgi:predicted lipoprotein with Yx(FWY)xxD motif